MLKKKVRRNAKERQKSILWTHSDLPALLPFGQVQEPNDKWIKFYDKIIQTKLSSFYILGWVRDAHCGHCLIQLKAPNKVRLELQRRFPKKIRLPLWEVGIVLPYCESRSVFSQNFFRSSSCRQEARHRSRPMFSVCKDANFWFWMMNSTDESLILSLSPFEIFNLINSILIKNK